MIILEVMNPEKSDSVGISTIGLPPEIRLHVRRSYSVKMMP